MNTAFGAHLPTTEPREIPTLSCRRQKRQRKAERYLGGQARAAYKQHDGDLSQSFSDDAQLPCEEPLPKRRRGECSACHYHLQKLGKAFNDIGRHGKERSKRCKGYPDPKKSNTRKYRNVRAENAWIRENLFDAHGNYRYCHYCILAYINVHSERLAKQRKIKQKQAQEPVREMKKVDVENERLMDYVLMPEGPCESFHAWWKKLDTAAPVKVRYPHERHGLAGKTSNRAKSNVQQVNQCNIHDTIHSSTLTSVVLLY